MDDQLPGLYTYFVLASSQGLAPESQVSACMSFRQSTPSKNPSNSRMKSYRVFRKVFKLMNKGIGPT